MSWLLTFRYPEQPYQLESDVLVLIFSRCRDEVTPSEANLRETLKWSHFFTCLWIAYIIYNTNFCYWHLLLSNVPTQLAPKSKFPINTFLDNRLRPWETLVSSVFCFLYWLKIWCNHYSTAKLWVISKNTYNTYTFKSRAKYHKAQEVHCDGTAVNLSHHPHSYADKCSNAAVLS